MKHKVKINYKTLRPLSPTKTPFGSLTSSIIYQQLSGKAAGTIERRFLELFPKKKNGYPTPEDILKLKDVQFRSVGVSSQKMGYLRDLSQKFIDGTIDTKKIPKMSDAEIKEHLIAVKGIGSWTADMFLIFALNRPNILPVGDLAIVKGFQKAWNLRTIPSEKKMRELARDFEGEHTNLSLHLWNLVDEIKTKKK